VLYLLPWQTGTAVAKRRNKLDMLHSLDSTRLRNDLYCVEWDVKLYYTIPFVR